MFPASVFYTRQIFSDMKNFNLFFRSIWFKQHPAAASCRIAAGAAVAAMLIIQPGTSLKILHLFAVFSPFALLAAVKKERGFIPALLICSAAALAIWFFAPAWKLPAAGTILWLLFSSAGCIIRSRKEQGVMRFAELTGAAAEIITAASMIFLMSNWQYRENILMSCALSGAVLFAASSIFNKKHPEIL